MHFTSDFHKKQMPPKKSRSASKMPTIQDVARRVGVSHSTVSRVLNHDSTTVSISEETRQRILQAVEELGYKPNMIARSLKTQRTQMIAVMIGDISNAFYHPIVRQIQDVAGTYNYDVLISNSDHIYEHEKRFLDTILRRPVDGIIIAPHCLTTAELDHFIERSRIPIVALGAQVEHPLVDVVGGTSEPATYEAVKWLIEVKGHRRIGFISTLDNMPPGPSRVRGYKRAMAEFGLEVPPEYVQHAEFTIEGGRQAMGTFLNQPTPPTAIFTANSLMGIGAILAVREAGLHVPTDFGVMGFDDIPEATIITPKLTTVARDLPRIGRQIADILFERILDSVQGPGRFFQSEWELRIRDSI
jgi:LacI family transcriptional regulator